MATRILSSDLLICDVILPLEGNPQLLPLIAEYNAAHPEHPIVPGSKSPLTSEEFKRWQQAVGVGGNYMAGGSAANTLSALKQLLGSEVEIDFIAAYGADVAGRAVAQSLAQDGLHLLPQDAAYDDVQTALSFVLEDAQGERSIVGYGGTSRDKILPLLTQKNLPVDFDILFLPGSIWQKYGPEFAQALCDACRDHGKKMWLSLPTHSQSGRHYNDAVRALIPGAQVVLANADELKRMYGCTETTQALTFLQQALTGAQVGFITDGRQGATIVTYDSLSSVPPAPISAGAIKTTLGAGDAAFAGFLYGWLKTWPHRESAIFAMKLAAEKMQQSGARMKIDLQS